MGANEWMIKRTRVFSYRLCKGGESSSRPLVTVRRAATWNVCFEGIYSRIVNDRSQIGYCIMTVVRHSILSHTAVSLYVAAVAYEPGVQAVQ